LGLVFHISQGVLILERITAHESATKKEDLRIITSRPSAPPPLRQFALVMLLSLWHYVGLRQGCFRPG
jgi:hypothetical protein